MDLYIDKIPPEAECLWNLAFWPLKGFNLGEVLSRKALSKTFKRIHFDGRAPKPLLVLGFPGMSVCIPTKHVSTVNAYLLEVHCILLCGLHSKDYSEYWVLHTANGIESRQWHIDIFRMPLCIPMFQLPVHIFRTWHCKALKSTEKPCAARLSVFSFHATLLPCNTNYAISIMHMIKHTKLHSQLRTWQWIANP